MIGTSIRFLSGVALLAIATPALAQAQGDRPAPISFGQTVEGEIKSGEETCAPNPHIRSYSFRAEANSRVEIVMTADDFDTLVEIGSLDGCTFTSLGSNDDGAGSEDGLNSRLTARLAEAGTYVIRATSFQDDTGGKFSLSLNRLPPAAGAPEPKPLTLGQSVSGTLSAADATIEDSSEDNSVLESGRPYQLYALTGTAGQEVSIKLDSDEFDPVLDVGTMSPLGYSVAETNDDGPGEDDGLNSRLTIRFRTAGTLIIRVSPLSNDSGAYTLIAEAADAHEGDHPAGH